MLLHAPWEWRLDDHTCIFKKKNLEGPGGVAQLVRESPQEARVAGLIPGPEREQQIDVCLSFPFFLSKINQ